MRVTVRVVVADDNYLLRQGVREARRRRARARGRRCGGLARRAARGRGARGARRRHHRHPHATDRHRRGRPGRRRSFARATPTSASSCSASTPRRRTRSALLEAGSDGRAYLLKDRVGDADDLVDAVRTVAAGGSVIDPKVVEELVNARARVASSPIERLTPREREILGEMAQGKSNAAIAVDADPQRAGRREAHQLDLLQAPPDRGARRQPAGEGGARVPRRGGWLTTPPVRVVARSPAAAAVARQWTRGRARQRHDRRRPAAVPRRGPGRVSRSTASTSSPRWSRARRRWRRAASCAPTSC